MRVVKYRLTRAVRRAISVSFGVFAVGEGLMSVVGVTLKDWLPDLPWWALAIMLVAAFAAVSALVWLALVCASRRGVRMEVGGNEVNVVRGDLFSLTGKKVIPFNECFDTQVDDRVISRSSLNGKFITEHVDDLESLQAVVDAVEKTALGEPVEAGGRLRYPLGTAKVYGDYVLLAFTRFNDLNEAHLSMAEYESGLMAMWRELSRVYAGSPIALPLLGSGITRFDDVSRKEPDELLKCMLCTLKATRKEFCAPITIVLTDSTADQMHLFEVKEAV